MQLSTIFGSNTIIDASSSSSSSTLPNNNPLWPEGIYESDVDELVDEVLKDPTINIKVVPDIIERQIYKTTIILVLNVVYRGIGWIHGKSVLQHDIRIERTRRRRMPTRTEILKQKELLHQNTDIDVKMLEDVADRLLANKAINQPLIPDILEKAIYVSCLQLVFRIINMISTTFRITFCGHDVSFQLTKSIDRRRNDRDNNDTLKASSADRRVAAVSSLTEIDTALIQSITRQQFFEYYYKDDDEGKSVTTNKKKNGNNNGDTTLFLWKRMTKSTQQEFMVQLHTVLYSLILGIVDDLLANTELVLLWDKLKFDLVANSNVGINETITLSTDTLIQLTKTKPQTTASSSRSGRRNQQKQQQQQQENDDLSSPPSSSTSRKRQRRKRNSKIKMVTTFLIGIVLGGFGSRILF